MSCVSEVHREVLQAVRVGSESTAMGHATEPAARAFLSQAVEPSHLVSHPCISGAEQGGFLSGVQRTVLRGCGSSLGSDLRA